VNIEKPIHLLLLKMPLMMSLPPEKIKFVCRTRLKDMLFPLFQRQEARPLLEFKMLKAIKQKSLPMQKVRLSDLKSS
jgi:hypothetical protein